MAARSIFQSLSIFKWEARGVGCSRTDVRCCKIHRRTAACARRTSASPRRSTRALSAAERVFEHAISTYCCLHGPAFSYLSVFIICCKEVIVRLRPFASSALFGFECLLAARPCAIAISLTINNNAKWSRRSTLKFARMITSDSDPLCQFWRWSRK